MFGNMAILGERIKILKKSELGLSIQFYSYGNK